MVKTFAFVFGVAISLAAAYWQKSQQIASLASKAAHPIECSVSGDEALKRFSKILSFETVSQADTEDHTKDSQTFSDLHGYLEEAYPLIYSKLNVEKVCGWSLLVKWPGSNPDQLPVLFISHIDVVPVIEGTEANWKYPPFSGHIADGFVWGRGALDVKSGVVAILEAWTRLLERGYTPSRTLIFAIGHDEEVGGVKGAACMKETLVQSGIEKVQVILDEGGIIASDGISPLVSQPVAVVGTAEKGYVTLEANIASTGGHSSMPPLDGSSTSSILSKMIRGVDASPSAKGITRPVEDFFEALAPYAHVAVRPILKFSGKWPLNLVITEALRRLSPETNALVTTTGVVTHIAAGVQENVLPSQAKAWFNFRLLPGHRQEQLITYLKDMAGSFSDRVDVSVRKVFWAKPSPTTEPSSTEFLLLKKTIQETVVVEGQVPVVAPYLLVGGTDSKHYQDVTVGGTLRFLPYPLNFKKKELGMMHGTNERLGTEIFLTAICFYERLSTNFGNWV
ncbi:hypothetical protein BSKO_10807 [Bryopsis sp. KO-2023]|nr:hypothetical protein BSKO_10807 [Bryopsis sp. KO-2023]